MIAIVLAAGKGTRMNSDLHKTLHLVGNKPILRRIYNNLLTLGIRKIIFIIGDKKEQIINEFQTEIDDGIIEVVVQKKQLGTADAVKKAYKLIKKCKRDVLVVNGDLPLLSQEMYHNLKDKFISDNLDMILLTTKLQNPFGYGRIIKENDNVIDIIEEKELNDNQKNINEINTGIYIFKYEKLIYALDNIDNNNLKKEFYLTDSVRLLHNKNCKIKSLIIDDSNQVLGVNTLLELYEVNKIVNKKIIIKHLLNGNKFIDINNTYIDEDVKIGVNNIIYPNVYIEKDTIIGDNNIIYENTHIISSHIKDNIVIKSSYIENSIVENNVQIGPFANVRPNSQLNKGVKIGNFVEIKNSKIDENTKCSHLTYVGDAILGKNTNIGAGTITCNYDGKNKHNTYIGDNCFIGSNSIFVSPVEVQDNSLIAAGSVITKNVPKNSLAFGRAKQVNKENYYNKGEK